MSNMLLNPGTVGVMPTDTVYGLVAKANDVNAVMRLYKIKKREAKPGTIIASTIDQLVDLGIKRRYLTAVSQFWPGAVSVIIPCGPELEYLHRGLNGLAVRVTADPKLSELLTEIGPIMTTSANLPGEITATNIDMAKQYFGDQVDFYVDGGDLSDVQPSTIIRIIDDSIEIVRSGSVKIEL
jgi:L-threonylcarbamoyladenylate synthase